MSITIEKASPNDAAAIIEYLKQIGGETDNLTFGAEGLPITVEAEADYLAQLENSRNNIMLVAKDNGKIVANATLNRMPRRMSHRGDISVAVIKEYWNKGIGSQLLSRIIDFAKENSFDIIDLQVRSDNLQAIHLYKKYGFQKICRYPSFFKIGNKFIDFDFMYLPLK
ncbi:MAG: GNAT family N-acetyltransferase [Oscillospiraceae bacterium]|nr:GNAT family N-acetyltransferase [Oscillospiraceae bacterium]